MSDLTEVTAADEEPAEASEPAGVRAALRRRLTETTTWTFLILLGIVAGFAAPASSSSPRCSTSATSPPTPRCC